MKILVIDNLDSFTFNLVHYLEQFCDMVVVKRNDEIRFSGTESFDKIVLSPGPGLSSEVPVLYDIISHFGGVKPILGVCLGHQAIAEVFGGELVNLDEPSHGKAISTIIKDNTDYLFNGLPERLVTGRYHSWVVAHERFPTELAITSVDESGQIMSIRHRTLDIRGVQFHPESIMTQYGIQMIENWVKYGQ